MGEEVKGKVVPVLVNEHHDMKAYGRVEVSSMHPSTRWR